jgi:hypothetical protein
MANARGKNPITLIKDAMGSPVARQVLGALSTEDLHVLARANAAGQLGKLATSILKAKNPLAHAREIDHPVAKVLAKLEPKHLKALAAACPPDGCPP